MSQDTAETAELLVSELVTNAVRFTGTPALGQRHPGRADASQITLSLRRFREGLLVEVHDTGSSRPIRSAAGEYAETGRGLMLIDALSTEWSYFFPPGGGKVVYCFLETR
jgi:anti-sigma regulatory factor (Ser/Thr protein kinase)